MGPVSLLCFSLSSPSLLRYSAVLMYRGLLMAVSRLTCEQFLGARDVYIKGKQAECWKCVYRHIYLRGYCV